MKRTKYYEDKQESPFNKGAGARSATGGSLKDHKGITLIALIITIIVMLILVAVTITMAINGGLFNYAQKAGRDTNNAIKSEQKLADGKIKIGEVWYDSIDAYLANSPSSQTTTIVSEAGNKILITKNYDSSTNPETLQLKAKLHVEAEDMEANKIGAQVTWVSSNEEVATVNNNGLVTALTEGTTEITAVSVYNGVTYPTQEAFVVTVAKTGLIAWVDDEKLNVGDTTNIHLKLYVEGTEITTVGVQDATWTVAPEGKVTIDKTKEEITAVAGGEVEITVSLTYGEKTYTDKCTVAVSYVGYYADINDDGTVDGVIYADLAFDANGTWSSSNNSTFSYTASSNLKNYAISSKTYAGQTTAGTYTANGFGEKSVLVPNGETGNDRFYVMALEDFTDGTNTAFCWYDAAYGYMNDYNAATSKAFGKGKANSIAMIAKWNAGTDGYGTQNDGSKPDVWGVIQNSEKYDIVESVNDSKKWFVPSKDEWSAFGKNLGITSSYSQYGLSYYYWSSSQYTNSGAWYAHFRPARMDYNFVINCYCIRLSATF